MHVWEQIRAESEGHVDLARTKGTAQGKVWRREKQGLLQELEDTVFLEGKVDKGGQEVGLERWRARS